MNRKIAIIGCGNLGCAIAQGLIDGGMPASHLIATRRNLQAIEALRAQGVTTMTDNVKAVEGADLVLLAVKPYNVERIVKEINPALHNDHLLISAATGIGINEIRQIASSTPAVFRAMPNTAADVKESLTCICHDGADEAYVNDVLALFDKIGRTIVIDEKLMEAATVLGACGIAYVLRFIRGMIQGGIEIGFDAGTASAIVSQTVKGAAELLIARGQHPEHEIDKVTTPRGCTITGLNEMEHNGFSSSLIRGIMASYQKIEK